LVNEEYNEALVTVDTLLSSIKEVDGIWKILFLWGIFKRSGG
jgi:hypothetical protein